MRSPTINSKITTFEPRGYITAANAKDFQQNLTAAVTSQENSVYLVDMGKVEFLDSAGLMTLVSVFRLAQSSGKRFSLCSVPPSVRIIFELTQLDRVFEIFDNRATFESVLDQNLAA
jgi:anti-sigma B factor antagonist